MSEVGPDPTLVNPTPRHLRVASAFCMLSMALAGCVALARAFGDDPPSHPMLADLSLIALLLLCAVAGMAGAVFLTALIAARGTSRIYDRLRKGDALADWRFEPAEWADWLTVERRHDAVTATAFWLCSGFATMAAAWVAYATWTDVEPSERTITVLVAAGATTVIGACCGAARWARHSRTSTMRARPRVMVIEDAIYCGGFLYRWGERMIVLRRIAIVPGSPTVLEVTIGQSAGLRTVSTALALMSLVAGRGASRIPDTIVSVPVPSGRLDEARALTHRLLGSGAIGPTGTGFEPAPDRSDRSCRLHWPAKTSGRIASTPPSTSRNEAHLHFIFSEVLSSSRKNGSSAAWDSRLERGLDSRPCPRGHRFKDKNHRSR